jgi:hypothetical protein
MQRLHLPTTFRSCQLPASAALRANVLTATCFEVLYLQVRYLHLVRGLCDRIAIYTNIFVFELKAEVKCAN